MNSFTFILTFIACAIVVSLCIIFTKGALDNMADQNRKKKQKELAEILNLILDETKKKFEEAKAKKKENKINEDFEKMMDDIFGSNNEEDKDDKDC